MKKWDAFLAMAIAETLSMVKMKLNLRIVKMNRNLAQALVNQK